MFCRGRAGLSLAIGIALTATFARDARAQWVILHGKNGHTARNIPIETVKTLKDLARKGAQFSSIAFSPSGGWVVLHDKNAVFARNIPTEVAKVFAEQEKKGAELKSITFSMAGGWTIFTGNGTLSRDIGPAPFDKLGELWGEGKKVKSIAFAPNGGWVILFDKAGYFAKDIPDEALQEIAALGKKNADVKSITFPPKGGWAILYNKSGVASKDLPKEAEKALTELSRKKAEIKSLTFLTAPFVPLGTDDSDTREEVLWRMGRAEVPGLGIALVNSGKLEWARGYGVLRAGEKKGEEKPATEHTRFQAGAISTTITALAALRLVQQKKLDLDQDLNARLVSWKVPDNEFTGEKKPTLRHALSHSAGFNLPAALPITAARPTLLEMLKGERETPAIQVEAAPGTKFQFSVGGYCVIQQLLTDTAGKPFSELMNELVFEPVGMQESTFEQPPPKEWEADAAVGHYAEEKPLEQRWSLYSPADAAAGLWTTPAELARMIVALSQAWGGKANSILPAAQAKAMLARQIEDSGMGVLLTGKDQSLSFYQRGENIGYRCHLIGFPATGQGAVIMTNSETGERLIKELIDSLRMEYGWP